jgi:hypothetical protein
MFELVKVSPQHLERVAFLLDLKSGADTQAPQ